MPQQRSNIPHATTKTRRSQINNIFKNPKSISCSLHRTRGPALGNLTQPQVILSSFWASSSKGLQVLGGRRSEMEINLISLWPPYPLISQSPTDYISKEAPDVIWCSHLLSFLRGPNPGPPESRPGLPHYRCILKIWYRETSLETKRAPVMQESCWQALGVWFW